MLLIAPALRPREVWTLRMDEAVMMVAARGALLRQARESGGGSGGVGEGGMRYTEGPNGTRVYSIDSMGKLQQFLGTGRV